MIYTTAFVLVTALILMTFVFYIKMSMDNIQQLVDKVTAGSYEKYKMEQRADQVNEANIELMKKTEEEKVDPDYL